VRVPSIQKAQEILDLIRALILRRGLHTRSSGIEANAHESPRDGASGFLGKKPTAPLPEPWTYNGLSIFAIKHSPVA